MVASGDSDMTPLLQRLRRSDRRTMIVSPADAAEAFTSIADHVLDSQQLLELVQGEPVELEGEGEADESFRTFITAEYEAATEPLNMASLAARLRAQLGQEITDSNWFGFGSFARAVASLKLPELRTSQLFLWDDTRHTAPEPGSTTVPGPALPEPVERLAGQLDLPRLPRAWWPAIYETLAAYAGSHRFNLTQCTGWSRDRLRDQGVPVSRGAVAFVVRGAAFGGCPLFRQPPPTTDEIGAAFVANVLSRAEATEITFTEDEAATVRDWLLTG